MNHCTQLTSAHRYHDGELAASERQAFEAHLSGCGECARELVGLRRLHERFAAAAAATPSLDMLCRARLHHVIDRRRAWRDMLPLARGLTGLAAAILLASSLWLAMQAQGAKPSPAVGGEGFDPALGSIMVVDPSSPAATAAPETQFAQLVVHDLGVSP